MSSIAKRPNGRWRARYRDASGKEHSRHFRRKIDAQRWLDEVTASLVTGQYVDPRAGRVRLKDYAKSWEEQQVSRPATASIVDNALRLHILPDLGDRPMANVRPSDIQALVRRLADSGMAPGSVRNVYDVASRLFRSAVSDRVIASTPCAGVRLPRVDDSEAKPMGVDQVAALVAEVDDRFSALIILLAGSGLRIGEALGLRPADVDFLRKTVSVQRQRLQNGEIGPTKTQKSARTVPLGQVVLDALAAHLAAGYGSPTALFTDASGAPLAYRGWRTVWKALGSSAGLTSHDLRHFYASAQIAGGASVKQVQTVLGHSSAVITLRTYAHLWPGDEDRTRSVIDSTLSDLRTGCGLDDVEGGISAGQ